MKIYKLTIGIDEKNEQVEFIQEEQYDVKDTPKVAIPEELDPNIGVQEEDFDSFIDIIINSELTIIGKA